MDEPYISVGRNKGVFDFAIPMTVLELNLQQMNELRAMIVVAIGTMESMWRREQERRNPAQQEGMEART